MPPNERILVIKRSLFDELGAFEGLNFDVGHYLPAILSEDHNFFMARSVAEDDPTHKQIIPYAIFHHAGQFLHYVRGGKSGEQRLALKGSIGIGGHINDEDAPGSSLREEVYIAGVDREINEELKIDTGYRQKIVALLNHDADDVGKVHLGVVHLFDLESDAVASNEEHICDPAFLDPADLRDRHDRLEGWSQICVENLDRILAAV